MDIQTGLVYLGFVIVSAAIISFISMVGIREKSYEEAMAEQRKLSDDLLSNKKDRNKEKKHKNKAGKKAKEKKEDKDDKDDKDEKMEHVQFQEMPQILPPEPPVQESNKGNKKKGKFEKIKPVLVNKDEPLVIVTELNPSQPPLAEVNHFDLIHPKDELELVRSQSRENLHIIQTETAEKINKSPKDTPTKLKKNNKDNIKKKDENTKDEKQDSNAYTNAFSINKEAMKEVKEQQKETPLKEIKEAVKEVVTVVQQLSNKEPKKAKRKNDILSQIDGDAINVELLILCIQKAELSRSEIQILTNQLLNKQQDNPLEHSEWTEGRADPIIKLKKQLAEKEKALADEHEANMAFQNKLKELRTELNSEKSRLSANIRQLEETLTAKNTDTQTLHTRMTHILETHNAEKQGFNRQIDQLQSKLNENSAIILKLKEDQGQTQSHMQQELMTQRKQMEAQFTQMRENENALKNQLNQKHMEAQELQNELQATCESSTAEIEMLRQQLNIMQGQVMQSEEQLQLFKDTSDNQLQEVTRQLEESHHRSAELDQRLKTSHRHEQELQKLANSLQVEVNFVKNEASEAPTLKVELSKAQDELMKLKSELSVSLNEAKSEAVEITVLKSALNNKDDELKKYQDKLDAVLNDLQQSNVQVTHMESKLNSIQKEMEATKIDFEKTEYNLKEAKNNANKYQNEMQRIQETLTGVQAELTNAHIQIKEANGTKSELKILQTKINKLQNSEKEATDAQYQIMTLQEENDRLHVELADSIEKQKELQQQQEQDKIFKSVLAVTTEPPHVNSEEKALMELLKIELAHKKEELDKVNERIHLLESDANKHQHSMSELERALEDQKSKNNELRTKNWKVIEAVNAAESRAKFNSEKGIEETAQKIKEQQEEITKALLERIFPEIKVSEKTYEQWLKIFEDRVSDTLSELKQKNTGQIKPDLEKHNKKLQDKVSHYQKIIVDTETMLNNLQTHVESEERRWESQFQQQQNEIAYLKKELTQAKSISNEKIKHKVKELDHVEQNRAEILLNTAQKTTPIAKLDVHDLAILEQLQEEKARLSQELEVECSKRATLDAEVTKLRSLVETSEASLAYEKNLVTHLQQEMSQLKNEICGGCSSSEQSMLNGPPTSDSLQSEPPLESEVLIAALENTLKNTEFANCSIIKSVNLVSKSEQEIENSSLTTKYSSKSCHMTDHNTQANSKPLIGQQHKRHKKKKKGGSVKK